MKNGLLLINLGTPRAASKSAVFSYLRELLSDKRIVDLPSLCRQLLIYGIILPLRVKQVAKAYQAIWTAEGSPLLVHSRQLKNKLQSRLGDTWKVTVGMRYGDPSLEQALTELEECEKLIILPLYPQYSSAASGSSIAKVLNLLAKKITLPSLIVLREFYQHPGFINAQAALLRPALADHDYFLFSYHGIPERHIHRGGCRQICHDSCLKLENPNLSCYKAQCHFTTQAIAKVLGLSPEKYGVAFQSRLGKIPWIKPYTDEFLTVLARKGIKRLAITCPSFVADCLETLEEIGMRAKKKWQQLGGEQLSLTPCVNDDELWVEGILNMIADD